MPSLSQKKIVIGVSGSIAAYKTVYLIRLLVKAGAEVKVIMTSSAKDFVTPLTFHTISKHPVASDIHDENEWNQHVTLGLWADLMIIAPATAHTIAKAAHGLASDMLSATYLSARSHVAFAPAMDLDMWHHPSTQKNLELLQSYGNSIIDPGVGELASGLEGPGRMAEPEVIFSFIENHFQKNQSLKDIPVLVNAGPTYESIDPVRFIGNHSSGKMGVAIAEEFSARGAQVHLVVGPDSTLPKDPSIKVTHITSAEEMYTVCTEIFPSVKVAVLAAAVADFRPDNVAGEKIKKKDDGLTLHLIKTKDTAAALGKLKTKTQFLVGFALETTNEVEHGTEKLKKKNLDMIVLNNPRIAGAGFGHDTNQVSFLFPDKPIVSLPLMTKTEVASRIVDEVSQSI